MYVSLNEEKQQIIILYTSSTDDDYNSYKYIWAADNEYREKQFIDFNQLTSKVGQKSEHNNNKWNVIQNWENNA